MKRAVLVAMALVAIALAQRDTLLRENFDGGFPPTGWSVSSSQSGPDYWHQQTGYPWTGNTTPYVEIEYYSTGDHNDTLFAPSLDCSGHRNIDLRCSTYYRPNLPMTYTARIIASVDGGVNWYTIRDYFNDSVGPGLEQINVDSAGMHSDVRVAWVWNGNLQNIVWWCVDNVTFLGTVVQDTDVMTRRIISPRRHELPGRDIYPMAIFKNRGLNPVATIPVYARIFYGTDSSYAVSAVIDTLRRGDEDTVTFVPPFNTVTETTYSIRFYHEAPGDMFHDNDTLWRTFTVSDTDYYYWDNDTAAGQAHWPIGGNTGWGLRVRPIAPCQLRFAEFDLLPQGPNGRRYKLRIVDDDGPDSTPGTTIYESSTLQADTGWNQTSLASHQIVVNSGSFYVFYIQAGDWPFCPELCHDSARSANAEYWGLNGISYYEDTDSLNGDWMIRCMLDYNVGGASDTDARAVYVSQPDDELSLRPAGIQFVPEGRFENHGRVDIYDVAVACSIYCLTPIPVLEYASARTISETLHQDEGRMVTFDSWLPAGSGTYDVRIRTMLPGDQDTTNDAASKTCIIYRSYYTGGPEQGLDRYHWIDSDTINGPVYSWIDTSNCFTLIQNDGDVAVTWGIGFTFYYRSQPYLYARVCNSGWMGFNTGESPSSSNDSIPMPGAPNNALYPFWDHLRANNNPANRVCCKTIGYEPHRKFVVIWQGVRFYDSPDWSDPITFEVILEEGTNLIYFQYQDVFGNLAGGNYGRGATVGIENTDGNVGLEYLYGEGGLNGRWPGNKLTDGRAILFYQEIRDMAVTAIDSPAAIAAPGLITPKARIKNDGSFVEPCYALFRVRSASGTLLWSDSVLVQNLAIQKETVYTFNQWNAMFGTYVVQCSVALPFDIDSSNNCVYRTVSLQPWLPRTDIPRGMWNKRVKAGALTFCYPYVYALKGANTNEFWRYDILGDSWNTLADMPAGLKGKRTKDGCCLAASESLIYAAKGGNTREAFVYSIAGNTWRTIESLPWWPSEKGARNGTCMLYAQGQLLWIKGNNTSEVWGYSPALDTWVPRKALDTFGFPMRVKRGASICFPGHDSLAYFFGGGNGFSFLTYNLSRDTWHQNWPVPRGPANKRVKAGAGSAIINDRIYLLKGGNITEFWSLNLINDTWKRRSDIPLGPLRKRPKTGGTMTASNDYLYVFKGGNTTEFWLYAPLADTGYSLFAPARNNVTGNVVEMPVVFDCAALPNPSAGPVAIRLALPQSLQARLGVYDITGKLVARVSEGALPAGVHRLAWNRRDDAGRLCANGVYILKFQSGPYQATRKLILQ